jgi:membrane complex biogenesis BtpA family protein
MRAPRPNDRFLRCFGTKRPLFGVIHLEPLPGSPRFASSLAAIERRALADARACLDNGAAGLVIENFGDVPFRRDEAEPQVIAAMASIARAVRQLAPDAALGVNVLRNASLAALGIAVGTGLDFIRVNVLSGVAVTDQGILEGRAAELLRMRRALEAERVAILADVRVKHAAPLREAPLEIEIEELIARAGADAVLVTGATTGRPPSRRHLEAAVAAARGARVLVASGVDPLGVSDLAAADGFVVGSALERGGRAGRPVDPARVARMVAAIAALPARRRPA